MVGEERMPDRARTEGSRAEAAGRERKEVGMEREREWAWSLVSS